MDILLGAPCGRSFVVQWRLLRDSRVDKVKESAIIVGAEPAN
jgi:hypothetical protein